MRIRTSVKTLSVLVLALLTTSAFAVDSAGEPDRKSLGKNHRPMLFEFAADSTGEDAGHCPPPRAIRQRNRNAPGHRPSGIRLIQE